MAGPFPHVFIRFAIPRKRVIRNLSAGFRRSYSAATKDGLARGIQEHLFFETYSIACCNLPTIKHVMKIVHIEDKEHVESALRKGKRAIPRVLDWEYPDQWNWLTVRLNKHHLDRTPDLNVSDSSDLELLPEDRKKDAAGEKGQTPDFMLGKHRLKKRTMLASRSYEEFFTRQGLSPLPHR